MNKLICLCKGVREKSINTAIQTYDQPDLKIIQDKTGAGCNCGRCIPTIEAIIEQYQAKETSVE